MYSLLSLKPLLDHLIIHLSYDDEVDDTTTNATDSDDCSRSSGTSITGPIVGGVIGGVALTALTVGAFLLWRHRKRTKHISEAQPADGGGNTTPYLIDPFLLAAGTSAMQTDTNGVRPNGILEEAPPAYYEESPPEQPRNPQRAPKRRVPTEPRDLYLYGASSSTS